MKKLAVLVATICLYCASSQAFDDNSMVKLSETGICHPAESQDWDKVENFKMMALEVCLDAGNALPKNLQSMYEKRKAFDKAVSACEQNGSCDSKEIEYWARELIQEKVEKEQETESMKTFGGFKFSLGIALTQFDSSQIRDVAIQNGRVVVTEESSNKGYLIFDTHKFIQQITTSNGMVWGHGPFFAASLTEGDEIKPFERYGIGWMVGFKDNPTQSNSWNIGLGWFVDTDVIFLREGIVDGALTTETEVSRIIKKGEEEGWILMLSASW